MVLLQCFGVCWMHKSKLITWTTERTQWHSWQNWVFLSSCSLHFYPYWFRMLTIANMICSLMNIKIKITHAGNLKSNQTTFWICPVFSVFTLWTAFVPEISWQGFTGSLVHLTTTLFHLILCWYIFIWNKKWSVKCAFTGECGGVKSSPGRSSTRFLLCADCFIVCAIKMANQKRSNSKGTTAAVNRK